MINFSFDQSNLRLASKRLAKISKSFLPACVKSGASVVKKRINECFDLAQDPYGRAWQSTLAGNKPLSGSGRLKQSVVVRSAGLKINITTNLIYAGVHNFGATIESTSVFLTFRVGDRWAKKRSVTIPKRQFLPSKGLPASWSDELNFEFEYIFDKMWGG